MPSVTALSPIAGPPGGGTLVTITGTNFTGASAVTFGTLAATGYTVVSPTSITATSPGGSAGSVAVTVTTGIGTSATGTATQFTYETGPTVSTLSPIAGLPTGGAAVTITGTNFTGATAVDFGTTAATNVVVVSSILITATSPAETAGMVDVTVVVPPATSATSLADEFTFEPVPTVSAVSPIAGLPTGATTVVLTGTNFIDATGVSFGTAAATSYTVTSATSITATSPPGTAGTVDVTVATPAGQSATGTADEFTYEAAPSVTAVSPVAGVPTGGASVAIAGAGFTGVSAVKFGAVAAAGYTVNSTSQITATSPVQSAGVVDVTVTTPAGTSAHSAADQFSYEAVPSVSAISPMAGLAAGGSTVTINGTGFNDASAVDFGATNGAANYTVSSSTQITATSPPGTAGTVDVLVTTPIETSVAVAADQFTYESVPVVSSVSPVAGPTTGTTSVAIGGSNFTDASAVRFGAATATFTFNSSTSITATSPAGSAGKVDVTVTTPIGTSATSAADQFAYETVPSVSAVSPVAGLVSGGTEVTITGADFTDVTAVDFGTGAATDYTVTSGTSITATSPAGSAGTVDVTVSTPVGSSVTSGADKFTYEAVPSVTAVGPVAGLLGGGTTVVITGTNFNAATGVSFGSVAATGYAVNSATQITATSPSEPAGTVDVTVTTPVGTSATSAADHFIFEAAPSVTTISPISGAAVRGHLCRHHGHRVRRGKRRRLRHRGGELVPRQLVDPDHCRLSDRTCRHGRRDSDLSGGPERHEPG